MVNAAPSPYRVYTGFISVAAFFFAPASDTVIVILSTYHHPLVMVFAGGRGHVLSIGARTHNAYGDRHSLWRDWHNTRAVVLHHTPQLFFHSIGYRHA
jgi:hypothetical protein